MSWYSKTSFLQTMQLSNLIVREKKKETKNLRSIDRFKAFPLYSNILVSQILLIIMGIFYCDVRWTSFIPTFL